MAQPKEGLEPNFLKITNLFQGTQNVVKTAKNGVIQDKADLQNTLGDLVDQFSGPVDFSSDEVIYVALGERPTLGYSVTIQAVIHFSDTGDVPESNEVSYVEKKPTGPAGDVITYPIHVVKVPKQIGDTSFANSTTN